MVERARIIFERSRVLEQLEDIVQGRTTEPRVVDKDVVYTTPMIRDRLQAMQQLGTYARHLPVQPAPGVPDSEGIRWVIFVPTHAPETTEEWLRRYDRSQLGG